MVPGFCYLLLLAALREISNNQTLTHTTKTVFFGEVGLAGEVRSISQADARVKEAGKLGFDRCILPSINYAQWNHIKHPELAGVSSLGECWKFYSKGQTRPLGFGAALGNGLSVEPAIRDLERHMQHDIEVIDW